MPLISESIILSVKKDMVRGWQLCYPFHPLINAADFPLQIDLPEREERDPQSSKLDPPEGCRNSAKGGDPNEKPVCAQREKEGQTAKSAAENFLSLSIIIEDRSQLSRAIFSSQVRMSWKLALENLRCSS
ncbi:hypothetical protein HNY73_020459 [Argiope bruennichi]|uniref:Uncharacterized protein n=1 Tax=Argiope bruennichi TaxID=94029 RepID=A0A8T0EBF4_ARGBR|nr:hypothetical protein HNY73_020459 [Argiope bruennichi]